MTLIENEEEALSQLAAINLCLLTFERTLTPINPIQSTVFDETGLLRPADTLYQENVMTGIQLSLIKCTFKCHTITISFEVRFVPVIHLSEI